MNAKDLADRFFEGEGSSSPGAQKQTVGPGARERIGKLDHGHGHDDDSGSKHLQGISSLIIDLPHLLPSSSLDRLESFLQSIHWESKFPGDPPRARPTEIVDKADEVESTEGFEILRSKGIFSFEPSTQGEEADVHVLQGVRDIFELTRLKSDGSRRVTAPDEDTGRAEGGKLVLIGKRLGDRDVWEKELFEALGVGR